MDSQQLLQMLMMGGQGGGGGLTGISPGQVGGGLNINDILRQAMQRRPEQIGYQNQITKPSSLQMPANNGMDMGNTNFGGLPFARSTMANKISGVGAILGNMREAMRVEQERAKQRQIQQRIQQLIEKSLGELEGQSSGLGVPPIALNPNTMFDDEQPMGQNDRRARTA
jgi:hypothetical protein